MHIHCTRNAVGHTKLGSFKKSPYGCFVSLAIILCWRVFQTNSIHTLLKSRNLGFNLVRIENSDRKENGQNSGAGLWHLRHNCRQISKLKRILKMEVLQFAGATYPPSNSEASFPHPSTLSSPILAFFNLHVLSVLGGIDRARFRW